jgi:DNA-binding NtrC family response regulator
MKLKAYDFIEKPIKYDKFLSAVEGALKKRVEREEIKGIVKLAQLPLRKAKEEFEKAYITEVLKRFNGDLKKAAAFMEIDISNLYRKLNKYGLNQ